MPVYNSRDLLPFVNSLEESILKVTEDIRSWNDNRGTIINSISNISQNTNRSTTALIKADEALNEIGSATFDIVANRGVRLRTLIEELRDEMIEIAESTEGISSVKTDPLIKEEIDNAISSVDYMINDGLKLDYRLNDILKTAMEGKTLAKKDMIIPTSFDITDVHSKVVQAPNVEGAAFVEGEVTVLNMDKQPILHPNGELIHGRINETGEITFNYMPLEAVKVFYPIEIALSDVPKDMIYFLMDTLVAKNSEYMQQILIFKEQQQSILYDIQAMKGKDWKIDYSIMKNHQDIIQESITPKGANIEIVNGQPNLTFSYNDHPNISHFEVEKWNEEKGEFEPYDGEDGIIMK